MRGGDWVRVPRAARVRSEATRETRERMTSYPVRLLRVEGGRGYWLGDRAQLFSAPVGSLEFLEGGYVRGAQSRAERQRKQRRKERQV